MASIRKRGDTWQARVSRQGFPTESKSFPTKAETDRWSRIVEGSMDSRQHVSTRQAETTTLGDLRRRYRESVTPSKRGAVEEISHLKSVERNRMAQLALINVTPKVVADYRDERLKVWCPGTVIRDLAVLSSIFNHARREWDIGAPNPVAMVRKPTAPPGRIPLPVASRPRIELIDLVSDKRPEVEVEVVSASTAVTQIGMDGKGREEFRGARHDPIGGMHAGVIDRIVEDVEPVKPLPICDLNPTSRLHQRLRWPILDGHRPNSMFQSSPFALPLDSISCVCPRRARRSTPFHPRCSSRGCACC